MTAAEILAAALAALLAGLLGSVHCLGMCAGIAGLYASHAEARSLRRRMPLALAYNSGRLASYAVLGAVVGLLGAGAADILPQLVVPLRLLAGLLIIAVGVQLALRWRPLAPLERAGAGLWQRLAPRAAMLFPVDTPVRALRLGLLWGLLPCGFVYSMLLLAAAQANAAAGAAVMLGFGVGTLPSMLFTGLSVAALSQRLQQHRRLAGLLLVALGIATLWLPIGSSFFGDAAHSHHHA